NTNDLKIIKGRFNQLAKILTIPLDSGSGYYWEIRKIWLKSHKKKFIGSATVYISCTMRDDRAWIKPNNQIPKRHSEARAPINRYNCAGKIKLTIVPENKYVLVQGNHKIAHENPIYRRVVFPISAKEWIQNNILLYNLRSTEVYRRLCTDKLINPEIHTAEQVYYWISVLNRETYIKNQENSLLSAKLYLEQPNFNKRFKVLNYLENDFIRALGFLTPLFKLININEATEIIVDSTFKTNQERFELFVVNLNCSGYGMPIAYLYLTTLNSSEEARHNPKNFINTRVGVIRMFFASLRQEGLLPVFILVDKDAGEISAAQEAWSLIANIQLCRWHVEQAIDKKIKEKKIKASTYSLNKALEAHHKFEFIDPSWVQSNTRSLCSDDLIKQLLELVKKHAIMHPLIPVTKESFMNSQEIYSEQLVPDFEIKLAQYNRNRIFPSWWYEFKADWIKAAKTEIQPNANERYYINVNSW
ncbi:6402_t:CDS:2, partial [Cetraspora pellucida]